MTSSRLVRGAKTRTIVCVCLILLLCALVYLFHGTQSRLADVQKIANTCNQQAESLSAQLEVLFEYKLRLEKSLQNEKQEKKKITEEFEKKLKEEKEARETEKTEFTKKIENLNEEKNNFQAKMEDMKDNYEKQLNDLNSEVLDLKNSLRSVKEDLEKITTERNSLKTSNEKLEQDLEKLKLEKTEDLKTKNLPSNERINKLENDKKLLQDKLGRAEKELGNYKSGVSIDGNQPKASAASLASNDVGMKVENKRFLAPPSMDEDVDNVSKGSSSTTPGINPQAVNTQDSSTKTSTKQTQENKPEPLPQPAQSNNGAGPAPGLGQIPIPPDDSQNKNINIDSRVNNQIDNWDDLHHDEINNAAIEDLANAPLHIDPAIKGDDEKGPRRDYPEREYKEDQGDEDDEEEERMGEFGQQSHMRRDSQLNKFSNMDMPDGGGGGGVMLNPK